MLAEAVTIAIEAMSWIEYEGLSERAALFRTGRQLEIQDTDALRIAYRFLTETQRHLLALDRIITEMIGTERFERLEFGVKNALRLIVYSKHFSKRSEAEVARLLASARKGLGWRALAPLEYEIARLCSIDPLSSISGLPDQQRESILYSHPLWFVEACSRTLGRSFTIEMMRRNQKPPPTYFAVNPIRASNASRSKAGLARDSTEVIDLKGVPLCRAARAKTPISRTKGYKSGLVLPVDKSSYYAALALAPQSGDLVLDACAAPGVKTSILAMQMKNRGLIVAADNAAHRLRSMREEFVRLGIRNAHSLRTDARNLPFAREFNRVLVDAPCTNSGLFMRTPSARWKAGSRDIVDLQDTQRQILTSAATRVAQNGSLVYSTCSVLVEENEMAVERFLRSNPDFQLANADLPEGLPGLRGMTAARRFYPHIHECNGFFIARLTRI